MIRVTNKSAFDAQVAKWIAAVKAGAEKAVFHIVRNAQIEATIKSPTYSGDFASNWNVSYGRPDTTFVSSGGDYMKIDDNLKAHPIGSAISVTKGAFDMTGFRLGQSAFLTNAAEHDEPYAWLIEEAMIKFRPVNVGKDRVLGKTFTHLAHTFKTIPRSLMV